ncbi:hypothetical protein [Flavisolibacter tropicus]|uniref:Outer membrane protein beta-barrel domain-containing protein n=1 Tax=Flavisolibacter tropicus TaxID=1492898 RepID=A0A172TTR2_9BACT|nr:hypothetical protein [Flavisolibacter tropicus]ANE50420.1 hypothetical protein SY85_07855 [Flavisolibacter tropicus]
MRTTVPSVRTFVFICAFLLATSNTYSQSIFFGGKNEIGLALGPSFFLGDLGGHKGRDISDTRPGGLKHLNLPLTKLSKGLFVATYPNTWLGLRLGINHTVLEGDDALIPTVDQNDDAWFRKKRNLSFKTSALEGHLLAEILPLGFMEEFTEASLQPYLLAGVGVTKVNPKTLYNGEWIELKPLMLEGHGMEEFPERKSYSNIVPSLNVGAGFKYYFGRNKFAGLEVLHRSSKGPGADMIDGVSTNYIDPNLFDKYLSPKQADLANALYFREDELKNQNGSVLRIRPQVGEQRGDGGKEKDSWFTGIIRFGWVMPDPNSLESRQAKQMRCPTFY